MCVVRSLLTDVPQKWTHPLLYEGLCQCLIYHNPVSNLCFRIVIITGYEYSVLYNCIVLDDFFSTDFNTSLKSFKTKSSNIFDVFFLILQTVNTRFNRRNTPVGSSFHEFCCYVFNTSSAHTRIADDDDVRFIIFRVHS